MACKRVPLTAPVWRSLGNAQKPQHSRGIVLCGVAPHIFGCHPRGGLRCGKLGSVMTASAGIHHVTAICSDPKRNVAFYTHNLGLRLVKKTVNFDDPSTWHLYYGDETGQPGTALTFFAWGKVPAGRNGNGMAVETAFIIPERSLGYWTQRLVERGISHEAPEKRFGETVLPLSDPDGMRLALVAVTGADLPTTPPRRIWSRRSRRGAFAPPTRSIAAISARSTFASRAACCSRSQRMTRASRSDR